MVWAEAADAAARRERAFIVSGLKCWSGQGMFRLSSTGGIGRDDCFAVDCEITGGDTS